jgi:predicted RNase H-like HicB family nuclease
MSTHTIHLTYHHEAGQWWVEADELPGYAAVGSTLEETRELVFSGLPEYLGSNDIDLFEVGEHGEAIFSRKLKVPDILAKMGHSVSVAESKTSASDPWIQRRPSTNTAGISATLATA